MDWTTWTDENERETMAVDLTREEAMRLFPQFEARLMHLGEGAMTWRQVDGCNAAEPDYGLYDDETELCLSSSRGLAMVLLKELKPSMRDLKEFIEEAGVVYLELLPAFGPGWIGDAERNELWSYDATEALVGNAHDGFKVVERAEVELKNLGYGPQLRERGNLHLEELAGDIRSLRDHTGRPDLAKALAALVVSGERDAALALAGVRA